MKYIFLDIDGVLNHEQWYEKIHTNSSLCPGPFPLNCFDPECVARVNEILEKTNTRLVISSWKLDTHLYKTLKEIGLTVDFDVIPCLPAYQIRQNDNLDYESFHHPCRGEEIREFLRVHNYDSRTDNYVIIDDDSDMLDEQLPHFFQTAGDCASELLTQNNGTGLTETLKNRVISFLQKNII